MSLILKSKKGKVIEKCGYDEEEGNIFYKEKKVGTFELEHDSALGSYYLYTINNGQQYHDHYFIDETIIKENKLDLQHENIDPFADIGMGFKNLGKPLKE